MLLEFTEVQKTLLCATPVIPESERIIKYVKCSFSFTSKLWLNMTGITVVFKSASYGNTYEILLDSSNCCYMPVEVYKHGGVVQVALYGDYFNEQRTRARTNYIGPVEVFFGKNPVLPTPTPSKYDVVVAELINAKRDIEDTIDEIISREITYAGLPDKPLIESVVLEGNKTYEELNLNRLTNTELEEILHL